MVFYNKTANEAGSYIGNGAEECFLTDFIV